MPKWLREGVPEGFRSHPDELTRIGCDQHEGVLTVTLRRPDKLNAFDEDMIREIRSVVWQAAFDDDVRVLVFTGEGRAFCAGRDIDGLGYENDLPSPKFRAYVRANHEMFDELESLEKPVVAKINGVCAGGGVELAGSCDFRVASSEATFLLPELNLGVIPGSGAASRLIQLIGIGRLKELMMLARSMPADEAERIGFLTSVAAPDQLDDATEELCGALCERAPEALGMAKQVINLCQNVDTASGRYIERLAQSTLVKTDEAHEGMTAFREKRTPAFVRRQGGA